MSADEKQQKKYDAANKQANRWETRAYALRDAADADAYLEERTGLWQEMVRRLRAVQLHILTLIVSCLRTRGVVIIPQRRHTMINFTAATYHSLGPDPEISYNKFRKFCDFGESRAKEGMAGEQERKHREGSCPTGQKVRIRVWEDDDGTNLGLQPTKVGKAGEGSATSAIPPKKKEDAKAAGGPKHAPPPEKSGPSGKPKATATKEDKKPVPLAKAKPEGQAMEKGTERKEQPPPKAPKKPKLPPGGKSHRPPRIPEEGQAGEDDSIGAAQEGEGQGGPRAIVRRGERSRGRPKRGAQRRSLW